MTTGPAPNGDSRASSMARWQPQASASGDVVTPGRATAEEHSGARPPPGPGGPHLTAAAPETRPPGESRDPPSN
eukprot:8054148-Alexandrium_andersonii.AAC.1